MVNKRITENIVRDHFKNDPLFSSVKLEEQKSYSKRIVDVLQGASKSGKGIGKPEFIVPFPAGNMDYLIVSKYIALFIISLIGIEKYRFNYGRKWHKEKMKESLIKLPVTPKGKPDWQFMEGYIKSLSYSSSL